MVKRCGHGLAEQTEREDAPKGVSNGFVHEGVLRGTVHTQQFGFYFLYKCKENARQHIEKQEVHQLGEYPSGVVLRRNLMEIAVKDGHPIMEMAFGADAAFDGTHKNEQEPTESDAAVHVTQPPVFLGNADVK